MAIDKTKLARLSALEALALRLKDKCGDVNVLEAVKVNGTALTVTDKAVDITLPVNVSDLANDAKYQTQEQVAAAVAGAEHLKRKVVENVDAIDPDAEDAAQYIYMVAKGTAKNGDKYDEYMVIDGAVEKVGDWAVDLSGYVAKEEGKGLSESDYTSAEKTKLAGVAEGATNVQATAGSGAISINGSEVVLFSVATDAEVSEMLTEVFGEVSA